MNESLAIRRTSTPLTAAPDNDGLIALCRNARAMFRDVVRVLLDEDLDGRRRGLDIESADGERIILRFRSAMQPEMLDGVLDNKS